MSSNIVRVAGEEFIDQMFGGVAIFLEQQSGQCECDLSVFWVQKVGFAVEVRRIAIEAIGVRDLGHALEYVDVIRGDLRRGSELE